MIVHSLTLVMINGDEYTRHNLTTEALDSIRSQLGNADTWLLRMEEHLQAGEQTRLVFVDKVVSVEIVSYEVDDDPGDLPSPVGASD